MWALFFLLLIRFFLTDIHAVVFFLYWICELWSLWIECIPQYRLLFPYQHFIFTSYILSLYVYFFVVALKDIWTLWIVSIVRCWCCCYCCCCDAAISITHKNTKNAFIHQIQTFGLCSGNAHHSVYINLFGACSMYASLMNVIRLSKLKTYTHSHSSREQERERKRHKHKHTHAHTQSHTIYSGSIADGWHCTPYKILNNTCSQRFSLSFHLYRSLSVYSINVTQTNKYMCTTIDTHTAHTYVRIHTLRSMVWCFAKAHILLKHRVKYTRTAQPQPLTRLTIKPNRFQWWRKIQQQKNIPKAK